MKKGRTKLEAWSAARPMMRKPQPPTGVIIRMDEALFVSPPSPRKVREKMVGNMMASKEALPSLSRQALLT